MKTKMKTKKTKPAKISAKNFLIPAVILAIAAALYLAKGLLVAAVVNGKPITRIALVQELEKQSAAKTLDSLITKALIQQEIARQKVIVSQSEVDAELKKIEDSLSAQGQKLDEALASQGLTRKEFAGEIQLQKQMEKVISKDISVSDEEVNEYIKQNKDSLPKDSTDEQIKTMVKEQLLQEKLSEKFQAWLADLQKKANIIRFVKF